MVTGPLLPRPFIVHAALSVVALPPVLQNLPSVSGGCRLLPRLLVSGPRAIGRDPVGPAAWQYGWQYGHLPAAPTLNHAVARP